MTGSSSMYDPTVVWYKKVQRKRNGSSLRRLVSKEETRTVLRIYSTKYFGSLLTPHQRCCFDEIICKVDFKLTIFS